MLKVKIVVVLFCNTIDEVQFPTTQLSDLLKEIRDMYYDMLLDKWNSKIKSILSEDKHVSVETVNEEQYKKLVKQFPCFVDAFYNVNYHLRISLFLLLESYVLSLMRKYDFLKTCIIHLAFQKYSMK